jgi:outer membrane immunogenic protein
MKVTSMNSNLPKLVLTSIFLLSTSSFAAEKINWTGPYIGGSAGYGWGEQSLNSAILTDYFGPGLGGPGGSGDQFVTNPKPKMNSAFGGLQAGYNLMVNNKFLLGLEANIIGGSFKADYEATNNLNFNANAKLNWISTFKAKAGTLLGDTLVYVDGGVAIGNEKFNMNSGYSGARYLSNDSETLTGWVTGLGIEHPIYNNITADIDYQHIQFSDKNFGINKIDPGSGIIVNGSNKLDVLNIGLNYHF